jgi:hypothetical protein
VDRRLGAILVADVVGYSRLMEVDEAGTARLLLSIAPLPIPSLPSMVGTLGGGGFTVPSPVNGR